MSPFTPPHRSLIEHVSDRRPLTPPPWLWEGTGIREQIRRLRAITDPASSHDEASPTVFRILSYTVEALPRDGVELTIRYIGPGPRPSEGELRVDLRQIDDPDELHRELVQALVYQVATIDGSPIQRLLSRYVKLPE